MSSENSYWHQMYSNAVALSEPSVIYKPSLVPDGDQWCAFYGAIFKKGVQGLGTPVAAMRDFDRNWLFQKSRRRGPNDTQSDQAQALHTDGA